MKVAFTEALLDDARILASRTYLMLLPDRTISESDPDFKARWAQHRALHEKIAEERPWVDLIDLTDGQIKKRSHFRDGFHLKKSSMHLQRRLFDRKLSNLLSKEGQAQGKR